MDIREHPLLDDMILVSITGKKDVGMEDRDQNVRFQELLNEVMMNSELITKEERDNSR